MLYKNNTIITHMLLIKILESYTYSRPSSICTSCWVSTFKYNVVIVSLIRYIFKENFWSLVGEKKEESFQMVAAEYHSQFLTISVKDRFTFHIYLVLDRFFVLVFVGLFYYYYHHHFIFCWLIIFFVFSVSVFIRSETLLLWKWKIGKTSAH